MCQVSGTSFSWALDTLPFPDNKAPPLRVSSLGRGLEATACLMSLLPSPPSSSRQGLSLPSFSRLSGRLRQGRRWLVCLARVWRVFGACLVNEPGWGCPGRWGKIGEDLGKEGPQMPQIGQGMQMRRWRTPTAACHSITSSKPRSFQGSPCDWGPRGANPSCRPSPPPLPYLSSHPLPRHPPGYLWASFPMERRFEK